MSKELEKATKAIGGMISQCKEIERDGKKFGIVEGHITTFDIDRGDDRFSPGAFDESIAELKRMGKKQLPLKDTHGRTIGGFPFDTLEEDSKGLFGVGEINLEIELGRDAYALAKQGVYDSFSVGFRPLDVDFMNNIREIRKAEIFEGSLLDIPMNLNAKVTEVKELAAKLGVNIKDMSEDEYNSFVEHVNKFDIKAITKSPLMEESNMKKCWEEIETKGNSLGALLRRLITEASDDDTERSEVVARMASEAGISENTIGQIVAGEIDCPPLNRLQGIARALNVGIGTIRAAAERDGCDYSEQRSATGCGCTNSEVKDYIKSKPGSKAFRVESLKGIDERALEGLLKKGVSFSGTIAKALVRVIKESNLREVEKGLRREGEGDWSDVLNELKKLQTKMEEK